MRIQEFAGIYMTVKGYEYSRPSSLVEKALSWGIAFLICATFVSFASAQEINLTCQGFEMEPYAEISFCLPSSVSVEVGNATEMNYSQGSVIAVPLSLNNSQAALHILYPCAVDGELNLSEVRDEVVAFDREMDLALYNVAPLNISGRPSLWGTIHNQTFAAYSPSMRTAALLIFEEGMPESTQQALLASMNIAVNETILPKMYCVPTSPPAPAIPSTSTAQYLSGDITDHGTLAEERLQRIGASKELLLEDMESTKERLLEAKGGLLGDMESTKERLAEAQEKLMGFGSV
jgi:hypothetical protein